MPGADQERIGPFVVRAFRQLRGLERRVELVVQAEPPVFHIVPRHKGDGLFSSGMIWKRVSYRDDAEREAYAARIRGALA